MHEITNVMYFAEEIEKINKMGCVTDVGIIT